MININIYINDILMYFLAFPLVWNFNFFDDISILRGARDEDFAPIKNKDGVDSPETAIELYNAHLRRQF